MDTFTGRPGELRRLRAAAERARAGTGAVVLVRGAPGIGKTALVRRFLSGLRDFTVLTTTATPMTSEAAFDCLSRLLRPAVVPAQGRRTPGDAGAAASTPPPPAAPHTLRRLVDSPAAGPLALFVDDAQWADGPSLCALVEAAHEGGRLCVVLAARRTRSWDEETLRALHTGHPVATIDLTELDDGAAADLVAKTLGGTADRTLTRQLLRHSGRHPLYLSGLLGSPHAVNPPERSWTPTLPATVVQRQLRGLPLASAEALNALAVLGGSASVPTLGRVLGVPDHATALDPLVDEELITRTYGPVPTVAIRHSAFRDALYAALPSARRHLLHRAAAGAVDRRQSLTHRVATAGTLDRGLAADLLRVVEEEVAEGRLLPAARLLSSAAQLPCTDGHFSGHLLFGAVRLLFWAGADTEAAHHADAVAACGPCPWRDEALGLTEFASGRLNSARRLLDRAHQSLRTGHPGQSAVVLAEVAMVHAILGQGEAAASRAGQALSLLRRNETTATTADGARDGAANRAADATAAANTTRATPRADNPTDNRTDNRTDGHAEDRAAAPTPCGAPDIVVPPGTDRSAEALIAYGAALQHGAHSGLARLADLPEEADGIGEDDVACLTVRGILRLADGRTAAATTDLTMALVRGRTGGARLFGVGAALHLAMCRLLNGDWDRAIDGIEAALDDEQGRRFDMAALWSLRSVLEAFRGNEAAAEACLTQTQELATHLDFAGPLYNTAMARAMGARARGDHRGVVTALQSVAELSDHSERVRVVATGWLPFLAESLIVCGLADLARTALDALRAVTGAANPLPAVADAWLRGRLAEAAGDREDAARRYEEAVRALPPGRDIPLLRALVDTAYGRVAAGLGRTGLAEERFAAAEAVFTRLGARPFLTEFRAERRAALPAPGRVEELELLTPRERQVSHLVGLGHTNQEIADELTLSVKTVEYHLRSIFGKTGVHNRRELRRRIRAVDE
ncbi:AAA family ATPase [Streptomyces sp. NPDC096198]|uniref:helix-turn-helix transcriptional regulator n=1 Tax=Streptomyces sp. NPDC096198 TaxID=3366080 RepID=UPI0038280490